jgi:hypothetical protein
MRSAWQRFRANVTIFSFLAGTAAAVFGALNYFSRPEYRPELVSTQNANGVDDTVTIQFANNGQRAVQRGTATLFSFDAGKKRHGDELSKADLEGVGLGGYSVMVHFNRVDVSKLTDMVSVCTSYSDEHKPYNQVFLYQRLQGRTPKAYHLDQLSSPNYDATCR